MRDVSTSQAAGMEQADVAIARIAEVVQANSATSQETSATSEELTDRAKEKVNKILSEVNLDIQTFIFTPAELEKIKALATEQDVDQSVIKLMNIRGYANVRNMCIYTAYILGAEMAMLIDDDELFEKEDFVDLASQYIGGRLYGKTIDGVAGYYLNKYGKYYDCPLDTSPSPRDQR